MIFNQLENRLRIIDAPLELGQVLARNLIMHGLGVISLLFGVFEKSAFSHIFLCAITCQLHFVISPIRYLYNKKIHFSYFSLSKLS